MTIVKLDQPPADYEVEGEASTLSEKAAPLRWKRFFQTFAFLMPFVFAVVGLTTGFAFVMVMLSEWLLPLVGHGWTLVIQLSAIGTIWAAVAAYFMSKE